MASRQRHSHSKAAAGPSRDRWLLWCVISVVLLVTLGWPRGAAALELQELAARVKPSVVLITLFDGAGSKVGTGTGFFVSDLGHIATNAHVVRGAARAVVTLSDGRTIEVAGKLASDDQNDIALLLVKGDKLPPGLSLGSSKLLRAGDQVVVLGSPRGLAGTLSTGIVSALRHKGVGGGLAGTHSWGIQITAPISPGSSGSPIMTLDGNVVAVAVGIVSGSGNLNFGVPIEVVKGMLAQREQLVLRPFEADGPGQIWRNLLISAAFFGAIALAFVVPGWVKRRKARSRR